ncbi:hypothetical protein MTO96_005695 [Rhipicephalus appendiculatus]
MCSHNNPACPRPSCSPITTSATTYFRPGVCGCSTGALLSHQFACLSQCVRAQEIRSRPAVHCCLLAPFLTMVPSKGAPAKPSRNIGNEHRTRSERAKKHWRGRRACSNAGRHVSGPNYRLRTAAARR